MTRHLRKYTQDVRRRHASTLVRLGQVECLSTCVQRTANVTGRRGEFAGEELERRVCKGTRDIVQACSE